MKYLIFIFLSSLLFPHISNSEEKTKPTNVILIVADDFGYMDLGSYGSTFYNTPNLDRLASQGVRFTNAYASSSVCSPSRASMVSGKYPSRFHVNDWIPGRQSKGHPLVRFMKLLPPKLEDQMPLEEFTIAEAFKQNGYRTAFVGKWHLGITEEFWPEHQGFDINKGGWKAGAPYYRQYDPIEDEWSGESGFLSPYRNPRLEDGPEGEYLTTRLTDESISFIAQEKAEPFFLMLSYYTVHNPLHGKPDLNDKNEKRAADFGLNKIEPFVDDLPWMQRPDPGLWRERLIQSNSEYASMVEGMDEEIGRILDTLEELGIAENTIVVFTSDNGGLSTSEGSPTSNLPLSKGKGWLNEGGIRVPLIISCPGKVLLNQVCDEPTIHTDLFPTLLDLSELPLIPEQHVDGKSLKPLLSGTSYESEPRSLYWHYPTYSNQGGLPSGAIRRGSFKLIEDFQTGEVSLFDLSKDVSESIDLSKRFPEVTKKLKKDLIRWRKSVGAAMPTENEDYDPSATEGEIDVMNDPT